MLFTCAVFAFAPLIGEGNWPAFAALSVATGLTLGFDLAKARQQQAQVGGQTQHVAMRDHQVRTRSPARMLPSAQQLISAIAVASRASSSMQGVQINLGQKADGRDQDRER